MPFADLALALAFGTAVGLLIGTLGGGGAILAVPVLVYVLDQPAGVATTISLVVVLVAAGSGLLAMRGSGRVNWRLGTIFGLLGVVGAAVGARLSLGVPEHILLLSFAVLVVVVAVLTFRNAGHHDSRSTRTSPSMRAAVPTASGVGLLTGFFGVGGGFVAVPALAVVTGMAATEATATSLVVIAINSVVALGVRGVTLGFDGIPLVLAGVFSLATAIGATVGARVSQRVRAANLMRAFAAFLVVIGSTLAIQSFTVAS
jgi:uncharacterized membrane protein YfcA